MPRFPFLARPFSLFLVLLAALALPGALSAQPLLKSAVQVDPGPTKQTGQTFGYRLTYNCSNTSGPCIGAQVVDLLPAEVQYVSTVPASATGDVQAINVTPNYLGSGRTRVQFVMINPLPAGNSGDLLINVRFPAGSTADGTVATNTADGINLGAAPGTFTTPPVSVTAVASVQVTLTKTLTTAPANLDLPETYRLRISVPNDPGALNLTAIGPVTDTLPPGTVFNGATPAADCQPGCVGTTPATVTWTAPCSVPLTVGNNCDILVNVLFPSGTFPSGTNVTNSFVATATPLGEPSQGFGPGTATHPVTTFVPAPGFSIDKNVTSGSPNPPTLNQTFSYEFVMSNSGNVALDNVVLIDTLPVEMQVASVTTGAYNGLSDFAVGEGVRVSYEKNTALGVFTLWGSSPNTTTNTTLTAPPPGLGAGEYLTRIRWEYGQAAPGMAPSANNTRPAITGQIINPDNAGGPVAIGDTIANCVNMTGVYTAGPTPVTVNNCQNFVLSGPFVQLNPAKDNLSGGGPFNPGQNVAFRLRVRSDPRSSDPVPLEDLAAVDLLPIDLIFGSWTFDDQGTGLPAPQNFTQIPNYAGTGRTLLRWEWNAGSGNLGVNQQVWINITVTIRNGAVYGALTNSFALDHDNPGFGQRCSQTNVVDALDLDGDGDSAENLCQESESITVAPIAQLVSSKTVQGLCDPGFVGVGGSTLPGGELIYRLRVQNVGTVPMQNFVLIDILPFVGDTGVRDTNPRLSLWQPLLVAPITPPPGTTLYYSTSGNPCRGEVGGPVTGCDPPNWSVVPPVPITDALSFKIEFNNRVVSPFDFIEFTFALSSPSDTPTGTEAFNSFAYQADRADGLGSLAAEPQKVGIAIGSCPGAALGDFVWVDTDGDGVQDDGQTGVNGVFVELHTPGLDGIPGNLDDVVQSSTVTSDDLGGNPGWYQFPSLAPGSYYVCFDPPAPYQVTTPDAGGNDATDSDVNPLTNCSPVVVLDPNELDPTIDLGLVQPPTFAALGNYVWFDRDADGIQDNPVTDGANGVAVRLFADDGDGNPEPLGDDGAPVASTVTADDVYGQAGYYFFDNLIPGIGYFVQFELPSGATAFTTRNAGGDDALDSDADLTDGTTPVVTLAPGEVDPTIDAGLITASGTLALGDQVWLDTDNDGVYEPQNGELGIDGVRLSLYRDANNDGFATVDEYVAATGTFTQSGFAGRYRFDNLAPGNYIVVVDADNFGGGEPLDGLRTSTGNDPAPDPDDDVNGDDNGLVDGTPVVSRPVTLTDNGEPTSEDGNNDTNLTVDFGFIVSVVTVEYDFGDNPDVAVGAGIDDYSTTTFDDGASHLLGVSGAPFLGSCVDGDPGTFQNVGANADDAQGFGTTDGTCAVPGDDEDGVTFTNPLVPGNTATFAVRAAVGNPCVLNAWVDWNADGDFLDAGEQIATDVTIAGGATSNLTPTVPAAANMGTSYARFRCASTGGLGPNGTAPDGEVEDYLVAIRGTDLGDAPASYGTSGAGAASHGVNPLGAIYLGACVDTEADGQPNVGAIGDDGSQGTGRVGLCFDDEEGVVFGGVPTACQNLAVAVTTSAGGRLDLFFDWNRDGDFLELDEHPVNNVVAVPGVNNLSVAVPCNVSPGTSYARVRFSSAGGLGATGASPDGEVEDYVLGQRGTDLGDAPAPFPTLFANDGARHGVDAGVPLFLGACVDTEGDGAPNPSALGDDFAAGTGTVGSCAIGNDDEDGVTFPRLLACQTTNVTVTANAAGRLDAWIDFELDGDWTGAGEQIATNVALVAGSNNVALTVPCNAPQGFANARFRFSSAGGLGITGAALDGEIEDHQVLLEAWDLGDAPASYGTLVAGNGARHILGTGHPFLGACVDNEGDGQPNANADGDDLAAGGQSFGTCAGNDDEDGVTLPPSLIACAVHQAAVVASEASFLNAWIDYNGDGDFADAGEQAFTNQLLAAGVNNLAFTVPCAVTDGPTYARFRVSSGTGVPFDGEAIDGEVEDYLVLNEIADFGDAPDTYGTTLAANGPYHGLVTGYTLGATEDNEGNGQPSVAANGDGADEDGITFVGGAVVRVCSTGNQITVNLTNSAGINAARLDAWIDFDDDGVFDHPAEHLTGGTSLNLNPGANTLTYAVPCTAVGQPVSYARFRLSEVGSLTPNGPATNGEVEDYTLEIQGFDFGDAPDPTYPVLFGSDGARHVVLPTGNPTLGLLADFEAVALQGASHLGDDTDGTDDEDGVTFAAEPIPGTNTVITLTGGGTGGLVNAWIDWNHDGDWNDAGEKVMTNTAIGAGATLPVTVAVPPLAVPGPTSTRFRISTAGDALPTGQAANGEVEDHLVELGTPEPQIGAAKRVVSVETVNSQSVYRVTYEIRIDNMGNVPLSSIQSPADISAVYAAAVSWSLDSLSSSEFTVNPSFNGVTDLDMLTGTDTLAVGATGFITISVIVEPGDEVGPYLCNADVSGISPQGETVDDRSQNGDESDPDGDGESEDNDDPTPVLFDLPPVDIPVLDVRGLALLALLITAAAGWLFRRA